MCGCAVLRKDRMSECLLAIDGNSLLYQAYHAFYKVNLTTKDGFPTGALKGFFTKLMELLKSEPTHVLVAFDVHAPTFRHERYADYKLGRKPPEEDLKQQMRVVRELLTEMGISVVDLERYEADDLLGTYAALAEQADMDVLIATGDRDSFQLITERTKIYYTKDNSVVDTDALNERYGLSPDQMRDLKALMGDSSDHIPGIAGIGEKTALKLLDAYGTLKEVLDHAHEVKGKLGERLQQGREDAEFSYWLGTICKDAPVVTTLDDCRFDVNRLNGARKHFLELELKSIVSRFPASEESEKESVTTVELSNDAEVDSVLEKHSDASQIAISIDPILSFAFDGITNYRLSVAETLFDIGGDENETLKKLFALLHKNNGELLTFDAKRLFHRMQITPCALSEVAFDAMIADYLLASNRPSASLSELTAARLSEEQGTAAHLFRLKSRMETELVSQGLLELYRTIEMPLSKVLYDMEYEGFCINQSVLDTLHADFSERISALECEIYEIAGERFNILSPKQLGHILYEKLELPPQKKTKSGYSTDAEAMEALETLNPIVRKVLDYRFLTKLDSTFIEGLRKQCDADSRIRTRFMQCVTATGRLSSVEPNLQNIPVRTKEGREIRKAFVPDAGHVLVGADYSQIELRLLAHISEDENFIRAFCEAEDIHTRTASEVFHVPLEAVTSEQRSAAKAVNFGIVYGISDFGLSKNLNVSVYTAGNYIRRYLERYPMVERYMHDSVDKAKENGYAETLFNRKRPLPELKSSNYNLRQFGERVAMNMPIQGSAADIIKIAMLSVHRALKENGLKAKLVLQVHDELIVDAPLHEAEEVKRLMQRCMEEAVSLRVPLVAEAKIGKSWYDTK